MIRIRRFQKVLRWVQSCVFNLAKYDLLKMLLLQNV